MTVRNTATSMASALCAFAMFGGCATPQPALDQANNGVALTMALQSQIRKFREVQSAVAKARLDSVRRQQTTLATYEADAAFDERVLRLADKTEALAMHGTLKELADSRLADEQALKTRLAEMDAAFAKMLSALPEADPKLKTTQEAMAVLGQQLSVQQRFEIASGFAGEIKKTIDENKKKIDAAAAAAPVAPVQPAASAPK